MGFNIVIVVILAVFLMSLPTDVYCHNNGEQKSKHDLIEELLNPSKYDSSVPPPTGKSTEVTIQLIINDTISENEQASEITSLTTVSMQWIDSRLNYSAPFPSVIIRGSDKRKPWIPGIFFPKNREPYITGFSKKNELIVFNSTGNVAFNDRITTRMLCDMNLKYYPYDVQHCQISLQSYAFTHEDVQLSWLSVNPVIVPVNSMKSVSLTKYDTIVSYVIDSGGNFSTLITTLNITRNSTADNQVIGTPVVLVLIGALSLSFGDNFTPKIALCGAALMTIIMHWAGIYNKIQPAAALICLDNWMFANLIFVGVIISYTAIRHHIKHPGERKKFKHLIEKSIRSDLDEKKEKKEGIMWTNVKTWVPGKTGTPNVTDGSGIEANDSSNEPNRPQTESPINKDTHFPWTVNHTFYAVGEDELRKKYFTEYLMEIESKCGNPFCKLHTKILLCDIGFVISFLVVYILFVVLYVVNWQQKL